MSSGLVQYGRMPAKILYSREALTGTPVGEMVWSAGPGLVAIARDSQVSKVDTMIETTYSQLDAWSCQFALRNHVITHSKLLDQSTTA